METISTSTSKKLIIGLLLIGFISNVSADFYYNQGSSGFSSDNYFNMPEYDSQKEIATQLVAPFIFITILLHFALSRALSFILASGEDDPWEDSNTWAVPFAIPMRERNGMDHVSPDTSRYSMIMSLTITASLVPTPYWDIITGIMASIGLLTGAALLILFLYGFYNVARALT